MVSTVEALQELYVSKGGSLEDVINITTIPDMIPKQENENEPALVRH